MKRPFIPTRLFTAAALAILTATGCTGEDSGSPNDLVRCQTFLDRFAAEYPPEHPLPVYIVLCDLSASMDDRSVKDVRETAQKLLKLTDGRAAIRFYNVTGESRTPFFETRFRELPMDGLSSQQVPVYRGCETVMISADSAAFNRQFEAELQSRPAATFLIQSVQAALQELNAQPAPPDRHHKLFILSDMLESGAPVFGPINLEKGRYSMTKVQQQIDTAEAAPPVQSALDVHVVYLSKERDPNVPRIWEQLFPKMGYSKPVDFLPRLPDLAGNTPPVR